MALYYEPDLQSAQIWPMIVRVTHETYLSVFPRCKATLLFAWYLLHLQMEGWPG